MAEKLGLYVHIPFCRSKCDYCDFYSLAGKEGRMDDYQKALLAHMKETAPLTRGWQVDTVYFGGGTPSFYGEKRLREVLKTVAKRFDLAKDAEITVECNPDSVDKKVFQALRRAGVNRISLGVQSAHDCELNCLHRPHTFQQAQRAVAAAREAKIKNISLDLIYGLPNQDMAGWRDTVEQVLELVDMVLLMTVNPGFGGQKYMDECTEKIQELRELIDKENLNVDIEVDGGINEGTIETVMKAGANIFVAGSWVFGGDIAQNVRHIQKQIEEIGDRIE